MDIYPKADIETTKLRTKRCNDGKPHRILKYHKTVQDGLGRTRRCAVLNGYRKMIGGNSIMKHAFVKFDEADQIVDFVRIITRYGYDADVKCGSKIVDAKSIVGVLSLARSKVLELIVHSDDCDALLEEIAPFAA